jgi:dolichol-phosphate mannosyltransferase
MNLSIVLPTYNEVENVARMGKELLPIVTDLARSSKVEVIFVDDGSTDGTSQAIEATFMGVNRNNLRFLIERHPKNQGLGAALRTGFRATSEDVIITIIPSYTGSKYRDSFALSPGR